MALPLSYTINNEINNKITKKINQFQNNQSQQK